MEREGVEYSELDLSFTCYEIEHINRFVTFKDGHCKIGRLRFDGSKSWTENSIVNICVEIIWLYQYWDVTGHSYDYLDKPWTIDPPKMTNGERRKKRIALPGCSLWKSKQSRYLHSLWKKDEEERKRQEKERKRQEKFERDIARITRKNNK